MNIFKIRTTWSNGELALLKLCVASFYVSVGIYLHEYIERYLIWFLLIFIASVISICYIWLNKFKF